MWTSPNNSNLDVVLSLTVALHHGLGGELLLCAVAGVWFGVEPVISVLMDDLVSDVLKVSVDALSLVLKLFVIVLKKKQKTDQWPLTRIILSDLIGLFLMQLICALVLALLLLALYSLLTISSCATTRNGLMAFLHTNLLWWTCRSRLQLRDRAAVSTLCWMLETGPETSSWDTL